MDVPESKLTYKYMIWYLDLNSWQLYLLKKYQNDIKKQ